MLFCGTVSSITAGFNSLLMSGDGWVAEDVGSISRMGTTCEALFFGVHRDIAGTILLLKAV